MRIAFLLNGMTGYLDAELRQLHKLGNELMVVSPGPATASIEAMADTAFDGLTTEDYADVLAWATEPTPGDLVDMVRSFAPDAVLMTAWNFSKAYRAVMKDVPASVVRILIMDNLWRSAPRQWLGRLTHRLYVDPVADAAFVPGDRTEFYAQRLGFAVEDIIRGSLSGDVDLFGSPPRTAEELASRQAFVYVGRLVAHKGADVLAAAYRRYREIAREPWGLHIAGIGPLEPLLRDLPGVVMHGFAQPPQVADLMRASSCLIVPAHIEPYGVVVHEGAAAGLPILCSHFTGAAPNFIQDGYNGWIVPSGDAASLAQAMARISTVSPARLASMSEVSRALSTRCSPAGWAVNLQEQIERRRAAGGGRLGTTRQRLSRAPTVPTLRL